MFGSKGCSWGLWGSRFWVCIKSYWAPGYELVCNVHNKRILDSECSERNYMWTTTPPKLSVNSLKVYCIFFQNVFLNFKVRYEKRLWTEFLNGNILCHSILKCLYFSLKCIMCNCFKSFFLVTKILSFAFSSPQVAFFYFTRLPFHQLIFALFSLLPSFHAHCLFEHLSFVCKWSSVRLVSNMSQMIILGVFASGDGLGSVTCATPPMLLFCISLYHTSFQEVSQWQQFVKDLSVCAILYFQVSH